ncbi:hypothetical protein NEOLEDRAFT_1178408 [Neolentinus lepideus HHB14362 ss-1]|uniref:Uncharacterized protein n=1 Tax=Neolentinus lepideus HHB14362 ss-1 TaxID=1314782 RepID=A0A165SSW6_9AGAM|nr:hypothetical protein NEOLEDRAFT_1178408 [Neolentinus lepideus HHB14362 ss-1]
MSTTTPTTKRPFQALGERNYGLPEDGQKVHVKDVKNNPAKMWLKLKEVHVQQKPARWESLASLMARADKVMQDIRALCPKGFTIESLNNDLASMALICALYQAGSLQVSQCTPGSLSQAL